MSGRALAPVERIPAQGAGALTLEVDGTSIGLYRIGDEVVAWRNVCPHGAAPVCRGEVDGTRVTSDVYEYVYGRDMEILQCPWHGWEFDLRTGEHLAEGSGARLRRHPVEVRDGMVFDAVSAAQRTSIDVEVKQRETLAANVIGLTLVRRDGHSLPAWAPGTHIDLELPSGRVRQYSLCGDSSDRSSFQIAVLRESGGRGGSVEIHDDIGPGSGLRITAIRNRFPLRHHPSYLLIAGGIGITALLPMIETLARRNDRFDLVYSGGERTRMAFTDRLERMPTTTIVESEINGRASLGEVLAAAADGTVVYACGPGPMLEELRGLAAAHAGRLEVVTESFGGTTTSRSAAGTDREFVVTLARQERDVPVAPGTSILAAIREAGMSPPSSCEEGWCGSCETRLLDGEAEHRDTVLSEDEREAGRSLMICVSGSCSERLVLDM